jgi:hypothetical protein
MDFLRVPYLAPCVIILLKPDARLTHQHGIRNKKKGLHNDTPTATATYNLA